MNQRLFKKRNGHKRLTKRQRSEHFKRQVSQVGMHLVTIYSRLSHNLQRDLSEDLLTFLACEHFFHRGNDVDDFHKLSLACYEFYYVFMDYINCNHTLFRAVAKRIFQLDGNLYLKNIPTITKERVLKRIKNIREGNYELEKDEDKCDAFVKILPKLLETSCTVPRDVLQTMATCEIRDFLKRNCYHPHVTTLALCGNIPSPGTIGVSRAFVQMIQHSEDISVRVVDDCMFTCLTSDGSPVLFIEFINEHSPYEKFKYDTPDAIRFLPQIEEIERQFEDLYF